MGGRALVTGLALVVDLLFLSWQTLSASADGSDRSRCAVAAAYIRVTCLILVSTKYNSSNQVQSSTTEYWYVKQGIESPWTPGHAVYSAVDDSQALKGITLPSCAPLCP